MQIFRSTAAAALIAALFVAAATVTAQTSKEVTVLVHGTVTETPRPAVSLHWPVDPLATKYSIWRKAKTEFNFPTTPTVVLDSTATSWTDSTVVLGVGYDYRVGKDARKQTGTDTATGKPTFTTYTGFGYLHSGVRVAPLRRRIALILIDNTMATPLRDEIERLKVDIEDEGWTVRTRTVDRVATFTKGAAEDVKGVIEEEMDATNNEIEAVFLLGRVAVPYSGRIYPDGHPDHEGAWPADLYYGDFSTNYSDQTVNMTTSNVRAAQKNLKDDGKFDASNTTGNVTLQIGRVDFYDMPAFAKAEVELLRQYLDKDHAFRKQQWNVRMAGLVDDNFGGYSEKFAAAGWRTAAPFVHDTAVRAGDIFGDLASGDPYLWAYGCGGGTNTSAGGVGTSADFAAKPVHAVFTMLFGSYFGDWDTQDNFLRAALASSPHVLTNAWAGRPAWYLHHMAMGENIGFSARLTQNNVQVVSSRLGPYVSHVYYNASGQAQLGTFGERSVHIALMGDPTLKSQNMFIPRVTQLRATTEYPNKVNLTWTGVPNTDGYVVYRVRSTGLNRITELTKMPITETSFTDSLSYEGNVTYVVRACSLVTTMSGSYYEAGRQATVGVMTTDVAEESAGGSVGGSAGVRVDIVPNPVSSEGAVVVSLQRVASVDVSITDMTGRVAAHWSAPNMSAGVQRFDINANELLLTPGTYMVRVQAGAEMLTQKLVVVSR